MKRLFTPFIALALMVSLGAPLSAQAALTVEQKNAVISLLQSFGVDQSTLTNVEAALSGASSGGNSGGSTGGNTATSTNPIPSCSYMYLKVGDSGDSVRCLQELLAADPDIYPERLITGYFGLITRAALIRYQKKHCLEGVGYVGPQTKKRLEEDWQDWKRHGRDKGWHFGWCKNGNDTTTPPTNDTAAPVISNVSVSNVSSSSVTISWTTNENSSSKVEYGSNDAYGNDKSDGSMVTNHSITLTGLAANATYHYRVVSKDASGNKGTSSDGTFVTSAVADTTAPTISNVLTSGITTTSATIGWTTNENATGRVQYGTTTDYGSFTSVNASLMQSHSFVLSSLTPSTLYHFRVISADGSGNVATSSDGTFTTAEVADTTAPSISLITVNPITTTTATVLWTTNENAKSKVYYGTTTPLSLGSALIVSDNALVTSHSLGLSGLSATTTYYFVVESQDGSGNIATSSESNFTTTN